MEMLSTRTTINLKLNYFLVGSVELVLVFDILIKIYIYSYVLYFSNVKFLYKLY